MRVSCGSFSDARRKSLSVRLVPEAEVDVDILNGRYRVVIHVQLGNAWVAAQRALYFLAGYYGLSAVKMYSL